MHTPADFDFDTDLDTDFDTNFNTNFDADFDATFDIIPDIASYADFNTAPDTTCNAHIDNDTVYDIVFDGY